MGTLNVFICLMLLKTVTFNARGLLDVRKFEKVVEMCKGEDLILLQETNWRDDFMNKIRERWGGEILYSNGHGRMGRGVAFLMKENRGIFGKIIYKDGEGKCMAIEMKYDEKTVIIINVHAPTEEKERKTFLMFYEAF